MTRVIVTPRRNLAQFKATFAGFRSFDELERTYRRIESNRTKLIFLTLFKTGCRAMECTKLTKENFELDYSPENVLVKGCPVSKQREKIWLVDADGKPLFDDGKKQYEFKSKAEFRNFTIRKDEPLSSEWIEAIRRIPDKDSEKPLLPYSHSQLYYSLALVDSKLPPNTPRRQWYHFKGKYYPHLMRSLRATSLVQFYGFDVLKLQRWFSWKSSDIPSRYVGMSVEDITVTGKIDWKRSVESTPSPQLPLPSEPQNIQEKNSLTFFEPESKAPPVKQQVVLTKPTPLPPVIAQPVAPVKAVKPPLTIEQLEGGVKFWEKRLRQLRIYEDIIMDEDNASKYKFKDFDAFMDKYNDLSETSFDAEITLEKWQKKLEQVKAQKEKEK